MPVEPVKKGKMSNFIFLTRPRRANGQRAQPEEFRHVALGPEVPRSIARIYFSGVTVTLFGRFSTGNKLYKWRDINPDRFSGRWPEPLAVGANLIPPLAFPCAHD